jgi:hypothetical protein
MSLVWYAKRLANMSPPEIVHRVVEQAKREASRRRTFQWDDFAPPPGPVPSIPGLREAVRANLSGPLAEALRSSVAALLGGRFAALGAEWPRWNPVVPDPSIWRVDPITGGLWPGAERYCYDIKYRHERDLGDVKYVWEFNRLQFLQPLAAAYALWGDRQALAAVEATIQSWTDANPPFRGVAWSSGIELALRAVSVLVATSLCGEALGPAAQAKARTLLASHLYWLKRYPSRFSSANNHLAAELMGEFVIALAMPELPRAKEVAVAARAGLLREAGLQILADGVGAEQSPTYGAFTAEMLLLCAFAARAAGKPLGPSVDDRLSCFAEHIAWITGEDGRAPAIGDDDEGRVLTISGVREEGYPASVANAIAGYLGRKAFGAPPPAAELRDAIFGAPAEAAPPPRGIRGFEEGGYTVVREERGGRRLHLVVDHGPLGYLSIAAHGHADANAIWLALDGEPVLVDPGTYLYHAGGAWRSWFRGTRAHNTLALGGTDQSTITGPFNWGHKANARREAFSPGGEWSLAVRHDGYRKAFQVDHRRVIAARPHGLEIVDQLVPGPCSVEAEISYQLAPGIMVEEADGSYGLHREGMLLMNLALEGGAGEVRLVTGDEVEGGWVSPRFGEKVPATRLVWQGIVPREGIRTRLWW